MSAPKHTKGPEATCPECYGDGFRETPDGQAYACRTCLGHKVVTGELAEEVIRENLALMAHESACENAWRNGGYYVDRDEAAEEIRRIDNEEQKRHNARRAR
jgi:hypothetical protein